MEDKTIIESGDKQIKPLKKGKLFEKFINGLSYYLRNATKLIWILARFFIFLMGISLIVSPFIIFAMAFAVPEAAVKAVKALAEILETFISVLR
jgi:hypothetical protein